MFIDALFIIYKQWKHYRTPTTDVRTAALQLMNRLKKILYLSIYLVEYYRAIKNEILATISKLIEMEKFMLNEVTQI
jgi:hypothetical protein